MRADGRRHVADAEGSRELRPKSGRSTCSRPLSGRRKSQPSQRKYQPDDLISFAANGLGYVFPEAVRVYLSFRVGVCEKYR